MRSRKPAVAGQFYSSNKSELESEIREAFLSPQGPGKLPPGEFDGDLVATLNPHAGYMYSGGFASNSFYALSSKKKADIAVVLGPNHYGLGSGVAVPESEEWETPLGKVPIDSEAGRRLLVDSHLVDTDDSAHWREHSIEVQLPFLQFTFGGGFKLLPVCMALQDMSTAIDIGDQVARLLKDRNFLLIASSDFTHYEPAEEAEAKDREALRAHLGLRRAGPLQGHREAEPDHVWLRPGGRGHDGVQAVGGYQGEAPPVRLKWRRHWRLLVRGGLRLGCLLQVRRFDIPCQGTGPDNASRGAFHGAWKPGPGGCS